MENKIKIAAIAAATGIAGFAVGAAIVSNTVEPVTETKIEYVFEDKIVELPGEVIVQEKIVNNTVEVETIIEIDNGNLEAVLNHIYDNDGSVEYIIDDLDDDEVEQIAERIVLVNEFKKLSIDAVKSELIDELDKVEVGTITLDEDDIERLRIDDDLDEIVVDDIDFEDKDATIVVTGTFEQDDVKYEYSVDVVFKDGEFDEIENISVVEE